jgi:hypothetical protein
MIPMSWHWAIVLGKAVLLFGVVVILIFGYVSRTPGRVSRYKRSGRVRDLLKIFSRY